MDLNSETDKYKDFRFVKWMSKNIKLQGIPYSAFYSEGNKGMAENYLRFCFFKVIYNSNTIFLGTSRGLLVKTLGSHKSVKTVL